MKSGLLLLGALLSGLCLSAQTSFKTIYGTSREDIPEQLIQRSDGGFTMFGTNNGQLGGTYNFYMVVTDASGALLWSKEFDFGMDDDLRTAIQTADDGYLLVGHTMVTTPWYSDAAVVKIDENGNVEWMKSYGCGFSEGGYDVIEGNDGSFVISGVSSGNKVTGTLMKISPTGDLLWYKRYNPGPWLNAELYSLTEAGNGDYVAVGYTEDTTAHRCAWVIRTDTAGNVIWATSYYDTASTTARSINGDGAGGFYITGQTVTGQGTSAKLHAFYMHITGTGTCQLAMNYQATGAETEIDDFILDVNGNLLCEGRARMDVTSRMRGIFMIIAPNGTCSAAQHYSDNREQDYRGIASITGGGTAILSNEDSTHHNGDNWSFLLIKTDASFNVSCGTYPYAVAAYVMLPADSTLTPNVIAGGTEMAHTPALFTGCVLKPSCNTVGIGEWDQASTVSVYPVPSADVITVQSLVSGQGNRMYVYNATGELVACFPINHETESIDIRGLPSGMYCYQLVNGDHAIVGSGRFIRSEQ